MDGLAFTRNGEVIGSIQLDGSVQDRGSRRVFRPRSGPDPSLDLALWHIWWRAVRRLLPVWTKVGRRAVL